MHYYLKAFNHYLDFSGRARRAEYWFFVLFNVLAAFLAMAFDNLLDTTFEGQTFGWIYLAYGLFSFFPSLAVAVRRLQDTNRSGFMLFLSLIPIVGGIWLLILLLMEGDKGPNEYGDDPKGNSDRPESTGISGASDILDSNSFQDQAYKTPFSVDQAIIALVSWMILSRLFYFVFFRLFSVEEDMMMYRFMSAGINLVWGCIPLALSFLIKKKNTRTIIQVIAVLYLLLAIWGIIEELRILL